ncbi:hypothetical protein TWF696_006860 [Orbilia brochopaga]|uniref:Uncharacterized protein n=1 Tax=Orbilia brochopaga TaxID=3140254 RepID=A0AAV9UR98_9PEZI
MASVTREGTLLVPAGPASPSRESTFGSPVDPSSARMRILVAPYYSPYIVSFEKVQTWEGLIVTLQRLFGPTFCSMALPPTITMYETEDHVNADNWEQFASPDCSIVVHTKSEDTRNPSSRPATSGSTTMRDRLTPRSRDGPKTEISNPSAVSTRENKPRLINRHANIGYDTPNLFDGGYFGRDNETSPKEPQPKRKRRGTLWNTVLNVINIVNLSSSSNQPAQPPTPPPEPILTHGPVTHISAMARTNSRKLSQRRRAKSKRSSRVLMQAPTTVSRQPSQSNVRQPLKVRLGAGNIMRTSSKKQMAKRRSIPPPSNRQAPVRRHIAKAGSDCSTCFGDDKNRDSVIMVARLAGAGTRQPVVISASAPVSSQSSPRSRNYGTLMVADRQEKADSITIFSSPIIEEFSLQPKRKCRPPSSAAATKTSSLYYENSAPPVPKRDSIEDTGFTAQYKLLDEKIVRNAVYKAAAARKAEENHKAEEHLRSVRSSQRSGETSPSAKSTQSNKTTFSERVPRSSTVAPKRSRSMGPAATDPRSPAALRRSETASPSVKSKKGSPHGTIDSYYNNSKHSSTGSKPGTPRSKGTGRSSGGGGFVRQSTPFDNKPLPKLPDEALASSSERGSKTSASGVIVTGPIATFEDLMSGTASSISESAEINSITQVTMVAGHPELR